MKKAKIIPLFIIILLAVAVILTLTNKDSLREQAEILEEASLEEAEVMEETEEETQETMEEHLGMRTVNASESTITWTGRGIGKSHTGTVDIISGHLNEDGTGEVVINIASLTGDESDGVLNHLRSADFFETETYPTAKLMITSFDGSELKGDLTIKDKTNPVTIAIEGGDTDTLSGATMIDRTLWGITFNSKKIFSAIGDAAIEDEMEISFEIVIE